MVNTVLHDPHAEKYNKFCDGGYSNYKGKTPCVYNIARALRDA